MLTDPVQDILDLLADGETARALEQLDQLIREEPYRGAFHALRALVLLDLSRATEAGDSIQRALDTEPEHPFTHLAAAIVALQAGEVQAAISAARIAQELQPDYHEATLLEARARAQAGQWPQVARLAREVADADPDNDEAAILAELAAAADRDVPLDPVAWQSLSARFPLNAAARTGAGWTRLTAGEIRDARTEFEQALALDPALPWAKEGLVLALKARNPVYALLLRYFIWAGRLPDRTRNLLAIGGVLGYNFLRRLARQDPSIEPFVLPIMVAYGLFLLLSWLADPLLNLALMVRSDTRRLLSSDDRGSGLAVGAGLALAGLLALAGALTPWSDATLSAVAVAFCTLPVAAGYRTPPSGKRDRLMVTAAVALVLALAVGLAPQEYRGVSLWISLLLSAAATWYSHFAKAVPHP